METSCIKKVIAVLCRHGRALLTLCTGYFLKLNDLDTRMFRVSPKQTSDC